jgi:4-hydroxy-tetrahydrodipicolinate reductase
MKILLIGYGKMGKTIEQLALAKGHEIVGKLDHDSAAELSRFSFENTDVAIEFTHPEAAFGNISYCLQHGIPVVSGSTGWQERFPEAQELCKKHQGSFFYASNFSIGVNLFFHFNEYIASRMQQYPEYAVQIKEIHHLQKVDKPSGTAITTAEGILKSYSNLENWALEEDATEKNLPIISERLENVIGTHVVRYATAIDEIELSHVAHSRTGFASGALLAAEWLPGKKGVFGMKDLMNL